MKADWIQSYSGKKVTPLGLLVPQVDLDSVCWALAHKPRFTGHTKRFYSVAEHCLRGAEFCLDVLGFLCHEFSEAYLPDVPSPIKSAVHIKRGGVFYDWKRLEEEHTVAVACSLFADKPPAFRQAVYLAAFSESVKRADLEMLYLEHKHLFATPPPEPWPFDVAFVDREFAFAPWDYCPSPASVAGLLKFELMRHGAK